MEAYPELNSTMTKRTQQKRGEKFGSFGCTIANVSDRSQLNFSEMLRTRGWTLQRH